MTICPVSCQHVRLWDVEIRPGGEVISRSKYIYDRNCEAVKRCGAQKDVDSANGGRKRSTQIARRKREGAPQTTWSRSYPAATRARTTSRGRVERRSARAHSPIGFAWSWCWYARQIYRESTRKGTILAITQAGRFRSRAAFFQLQKTKTKRAPPKAAAAGLKQKGGDSFS